MPSALPALAFALMLLTSQAYAQQGSPPAPASLPAASAAISRIAFGSCARQDRPQPIWDAILDAKPDLFLMIGDNIYGDSRDMSVLRRKYDQLFAQPSFMRLRQGTPLLAIWDDHDYGENDAGTEYPMKVQSQQLFCEVFGVPQDSPRRKRPGLYDAYLYGPEDRRLQVILLDTRYFRSPLTAKLSLGKGRYAPNPDPAMTMLGQEQWAWLKQQLKVPARVRIIASSIQVVSEEHPFEKWANFPLERQKLFQLIAATKASGVVMISGDRHLSELSIDREAGPYPMIDLTGSSLNQPSNTKSEANRHRTGKLITEVNFGEIRIDWEQADPVIDLLLRDVKGQVLQSEKVKLSTLQAK